MAILRSTGINYPALVAIQTYMNEVKADRALTSSHSCVTERIGADAYTDGADLKNNPVLDMVDVCPTAEAVPLTSDAAKLKQAIANLSVSGLTAGHIGLGWGWYALSPNLASQLWPNAQPPANYDDDVLKVLVLMTDGEFNLDYSGTGSSEQALSLCTAIKEKGVIIYTVGFQAPPAADTMLQKCASNAGTYFDADSGTALKEAFQRIAAETAALRLSM